jgi:hypothetical protein
MNTKCTKWSLNIPNGRKISQMTINYLNIFQSKSTPKFSQVGIFGLKNKLSGNPGQESRSSASASAGRKKIRIKIKIELANKTGKQIVFPSDGNALKSKKRKKGTRTECEK